MLQPLSPSKQQKNLQSYYVPIHCVFVHVCMCVMCMHIHCMFVCLCVYGVYAQQFCFFGFPTSNLRCSS